MADQRPIGYWLRLVDRMIDEQFAATLEEHGVTRRQWQLLSVLRNGTATVQQLDAAIAPFLSPDVPESASEHLTELIDSGWVDDTATGYELTERGVIACTRLGEVVQANRERATEGVSREQYDSTLTTLERIARNLGYTDPA
jgi:predicted transcriptional regulator